MAVEERHVAASDVIIGQRIGADCTAVGEVRKHSEPLSDDPMPPTALDVGDEEIAGAGIDPINAQLVDVRLFAVVGRSPFVLVGAHFSELVGPVGGSARQRGPVDIQPRRTRRMAIN